MIEAVEYPKSLKRRDGKMVVVRTLKNDDEAMVTAFINGLPPIERAYFWDDPADPEILRCWVNSANCDKIFPLIALVDGKVVSVWTLTHDPHSWTRHIGYIWGVVDPAHRNTGVGTIMVRELLAYASQYEMERVALELVRMQQKGQIAHFTHLGFEVTAIKRDWVKDPDGQYHDMVVISMEVEPAWRKMDELMLKYSPVGG